MSWNRVVEGRNLGFMTVGARPLYTLPHATALPQVLSCSSDPNCVMYSNRIEFTGAVYVCRCAKEIYYLGC